MLFLALSNIFLSFLSRSVISYSNSFCLLLFEVVRTVRTIVPYPLLSFDTFLFGEELFVESICFNYFNRDKDVVSD